MAALTTLTFKRDLTPKALENYPIRAYVPLEENPNEFEYKRFSGGHEDKNLSPTLADSVKHLSIANTCRHTALALIASMIAHGQAMVQYISSLYLSKLPYRATHNRDFTMSQIYILPTPPNAIAQNTNPVLRNMLTLLFHQLQKLPQLNPESEHTRAKFEALKHLYNTLLNNTVPQIDFNTLHADIQSWDEEYAPTINQHRRIGFFSTLNPSKTRSRHLIDTLKQNCSRHCQV